MVYLSHFTLLIGLNVLSKINLSESRWCMFEDEMRLLKNYQGEEYYVR